MSKKYPLIYASIAILIGMDISCIKGVLRIDNYRDIKKEIKEVLCVTDVNFHQIIDERGVEPSKWQRVPSEDANEYALSAIKNYVQTFFGYSRNRSLIDCRIAQFDSTQRAIISNMFSQLNSLKDIEQYTLNEDVIRLFTNINDRYVLLLSQNGYHYSEDYISKLEAREALITIVSTATLVGGVAAAGFGTGTFVFYKKGISSMSMALLDLQKPKVLFYSGNSFQDNPLADSIIYRQLQSLFYYF